MCPTLNRHRRYLLSVQPRDAPDDDAAEGGSSHMNVNGRGDGGHGEEGGKRLSGAQRKKLAKEERKSKRGANKGRRFQKVRDEVELCYKVASGKQCDFGSECVSLFPQPPALQFVFRRTRRPSPLGLSPRARPSLSPGLGTLGPPRARPAQPIPLDAPVGARAHHEPPPS